MPFCTIIRKGLGRKNRCCCGDLLHPIAGLSTRGPWRGAGPWLLFLPPQGPVGLQMLETVLETQSGIWPNMGVTRSPGQRLCPCPFLCVQGRNQGERVSHQYPPPCQAHWSAPPLTTRCSSLNLPPLPCPGAFLHGPETPSLLHLPWMGVEACFPIPVAPASSRVPRTWEMLHKVQSNDGCSQTCLNEGAPAPPPPWGCHR